VRKRSFRLPLNLRFSTPNKGDYGVRKRSFRPSLKLRFSTPNKGDYGVRKRSFRPSLKLRFSTPNKGDYGVRKRSFRPSLKLTKACAPLPPSGKGAGGEGLLPGAPSQRQTRQAPLSSVMLAGSGINSCEKPILSIATFQSLPKRISITPPLTTFGSNEKVFA
jgi:hypothetical protein